MYRKILVGYDDSDQAKDALAQYGAQKVYVAESDERLIEQIRAGSERASRISRKRSRRISFCGIVRRMCATYSATSSSLAAPWGTSGGMT